MPRSHQPDRTISLRSNIRVIKRRLGLFALERRVVSFGGVASSSLVRHIENGDEDLIWYHSRKKHCLHPDLLPEAQRGLPVRAVFIYGDPIDAVASVFRRGFHVQHELSMSRDLPDYERVLTAETTLEEYAAAGVDRFFLDTHVRNWLEYEGERVQVIAVRYEHLGGHIDEVMEFLGCDRPFEVRERTKRPNPLADPVREGLEEMYGDLAVRIRDLPPMVRVT